MIIVDRKGVTCEPSDNKLQRPPITKSDWRISPRLGFVGEHWTLWRNIIEGINSAKKASRWLCGSCQRGPDKGRRSPLCLRGCWFRILGGLAAICCQRSEVRPATYQLTPSLPPAKYRPFKFCFLLLSKMVTEAGYHQRHCLSVSRKIYENK